MPLKNELYDIGFSQNDCFLCITQLFIYGLYVNLQRDFYITSFWRPLPFRPKEDLCFEKGFRTDRFTSFFLTTGLKPFDWAHVEARSYS